VLKDACRSDVAFIRFASPMPKLLDFIGGSTRVVVVATNAKTVCCTKWLGISNLMEKPVKLPSAFHAGQFVAIR